MASVKEVFDDALSELQSLIKAKKVPVGTRSADGKKWKIAEGKWVPVPKGEREATARASRLGAYAAKMGKPDTPSSDPEMKTMIGTRRREGVGGETSKLKAAWLAGWRAEKEKWQKKSEKLKKKSKKK